METPANRSVRDFVFDAIDKSAISNPPLPMYFCTTLAFSGRSIAFRVVFFFLSRRKIRDKKKSRTRSRTLYLSINARPRAHMYVFFFFYTVICTCVCAHKVAREDEKGRES